MPYGHFRTIFIQKYNHEHKLIQEQIPVEATFCVLYFMTHNYIILLPELVFDSTLMLP